MNKVANILKNYAWLNACCGVLLGGGYFGLYEEEIGLAIMAIAIVAVVSFGIYAFGEVIQLLQDIKDNTMATAMKGTGTAVNKLASQISNNEVPKI